MIRVRSIPTASLLATLGELLGEEYVTTAEYARIGRLAKIVARRQGTTRDAVLAAVRVSA